MSRPPNHAAAVLISGGLDSAILCVDLLRDFSRVVPLYIRSGLRWEEAEMSSLERFLDAVKTDGVGTPGRPRRADRRRLRHALEHRPATGVPGSETPDEAVYLPGRNLLLTVKAAVWCRLREIDTLALGSLGSNPFPDSTPDFFEKLESLHEPGDGRKTCG